MKTDYLPIAIFLILVALVGYLFLEKQEKETQLELLKTQIEGQLPEGISLRDYQMYQAGRAGVVQEVQNALRIMREENRLEEFGWTFEIEGEEIKLRVE